MNLDRAIDLVKGERVRQREQWGNQHDNVRPVTFWGPLLTKHAGLLFDMWDGQEPGVSQLVARLTKIAAIAVAGSEAIDRVHIWPTVYSRFDSDDVEAQAAHTVDVCAEVMVEQTRQDTKFGWKRNMDKYNWMCVLGEEIGEVCEAGHEIVESRVEFREGMTKLVKELVQVAAVAVNMAEHISRGDRQ